MPLALPGSGALALPTGSTVVGAPATGDRSSLVATMQKFADEFVNVKAASGYQKLPSGIIIQWASVSQAVTNGVQATIVGSWPIAFPTALLGMATRQNVSISNNNTYMSADPASTTGFTFYVNTNTNQTFVGTAIGIGY